VISGSYCDRSDPQLESVLKHTLQIFLRSGFKRIEFRGIFIGTAGRAKWEMPGRAKHFWLGVVKWLNRLNAADVAGGQRGF
jgi:hypothetical protein